MRGDRLKENIDNLFKLFINKLYINPGETEAGGGGASDRGPLRRESRKNLGDV
jgi:hypothetical protein